MELSYKIITTPRPLFLRLEPSVGKPGTAWVLIGLRDEFHMMEILKTIWQSAVVTSGSNGVEIGLTNNGLFSHIYNSKGSQPLGLFFIVYLKTYY